MVSVTPLGTPAPAHSAGVAPQQMVETHRREQDGGVAAQPAEQVLNLVGGEAPPGTRTSVPTFGGGQPFVPRCPDRSAGRHRWAQQLRPLTAANPDALCPSSLDDGRGDVVVIGERGANDEGDTGKRAEPSSVRSRPRRRLRVPASAWRKRSGQR